MGFTDVLRKSFPFISIAASMGGPLGVMAANVVGKAIGADKAPAPTQDAIANVIAGAIGDPAQRAALVKAEQDFQLQMAELGYKNAEDLEQIIDADRANARNREIQVRDWTPKLLAIAISTGFFSILGMMFFHKIPDAGHDALMLMLGSLGTAWTGIIAYYFGSSAGSDRKTELLSQAAPIPQK